MMEWFKKINSAFWRAVEQLGGFVDDAIADPEDNFPRIKVGDVEWRVVSKQGLYYALERDASGCVMLSSIAQDDPRIVWVKDGPKRVPQRNVHIWE